jgi:hypothetical protein
MRQRKQRRNVTMKKFKVETPNKNFNGERLGCKFTNGVCVCDCGNENKLKEFESWGYKVEEIKEKQPEAPKEEKKEAPKKTSTKKTQTKK